MGWGWGGVGVAVYLSSYFQIISSGIFWEGGSEGGNEGGSE